MKKGKSKVEMKGERKEKRIEGKERKEKREDRKEANSQVLELFLKNPKHKRTKILSL